MPIDYNLPVYPQIVEEYKRQIASGKLKPGEKIASVRDLAPTFKVNPNTMQRALAQLEEDSLVFADRTTGRYVTNDSGVIEEMRKSMFRAEVRKFKNAVHALGYTTEQACWFIEEEEKGE